MRREQYGVVSRKLAVYHDTQTASRFTINKMTGEIDAALAIML